MGEICEPDQNESDRERGKEMDNNRMLLKNCPISCFADEIDPKIDKSWRSLKNWESAGLR